MGEIISIFISPEAGVPMQELERVLAMEGIGLEGDRYALGIGAYSKAKRLVIRHVSLISEEAIAEANALFRTSFTPSETRRNLLTRGVDLNSLVGETFKVGPVYLWGVELCDPCARPSNLLGKQDIDKPNFEAAFERRGGLRAEVLTDGIISIGDPIIHSTST